MPEPIDDPAYWAARLAHAREAGEEHLAVFRCPPDRWRAIEAKHRDILARQVGPGDSVLDAGCGWGRLLDLMPPGWRGTYVGLDRSPDFIRKAWLERPGRTFLVADLRRIPLAAYPGHAFDWAVLVSVRPMVRRNLGGDEWDRMEAELRRLARRLLYLEYDPDDEGSVE